MSGEIICCAHQDCDNESKIWFKETDEPVSDIRLHPWCVNCGEIKNISDDKPKDLGYWINNLAILSTKFKIAKVQRRLVARELRLNDGFSNLYGITGSTQCNIFINVVTKYCKISKFDIERLIR